MLARLIGQEYSVPTGERKMLIRIASSKSLIFVAIFLVEKCQWDALVAAGSI